MNSSINSALILCFAAFCAVGVWSSCGIMIVLYIVLAHFTSADATHVAAEKCVNYKMLVVHTEGVPRISPKA